MRPLLLALYLLFSSFVCAKTVTDITGRQVTIPDNPQRIVLGESRMLYTLGLLEPGYPAGKIIGWPGDMAKYDPQTWSVWLKTFPQLASITQLGDGFLSQSNIEQVISLKPDLVILPQLAKNSHSENQFIELLAQAHIPVIKIDLRVDLLHNTVPSIRLLGEVLNQQQRAQSFIDFYQQHMAQVEKRLATINEPKPRVFLHLHLGRRDTCCTTVAHGNLGQLLDFAGGDNIAKSLLKGVFGNLSSEQLLASQPEVYIGTGMSNSGRTLQLGPQVSQQQAESSMKRAIAAQQPLSYLNAIRQGNAWGLWHNFYLSPYHVAAVEFFAKTFYPQQFADINPEQTLKTLYQRFLPIPYSGTFWVRLPVAK